MFVRVPPFVLVLARRNKDLHLELGDAVSNFGLGGRLPLDSGTGLGTGRGTGLRFGTIFGFGTGLGKGIGLSNAIGKGSVRELVTSTLASDLAPTSVKALASVMQLAKAAVSVQRLCISRVLSRLSQKA